MEKLMEILKGIRPDVDFENANDLIYGEVLDSFDVISIVSEINESFGVEINVDDLVPENFNSVSAMYALIRKMQGN